MLDQELTKAVDKFEADFTRQPDPEKRPGVLSAFRAGWDALSKLLGGDEPRHAVHADGDGWRMMHSLECRLAGIESCEFADFIAAYGTPGTGTYWMEPDGDTFMLTAV